MEATKEMIDLYIERVVDKLFFFHKIDSKQLSSSSLKERVSGLKAEKDEAIRRYIDATNKEYEALEKELSLLLDLVEESERLDRGLTQL